MQAGIVGKAAVPKPEAANLSVKNGDKSCTRNDLSTDESSYSSSMVCDAAGTDQVCVIGCGSIVNAFLV